MRKLLIISLLIFIFIRVDSKAQTTEEITRPYTFIRDTLNYLINDSALSGFYKKLDELQNGTRDKVVVVQIGDSHIQADYFSGMMREQLQRKFGNAGRGLVFPYRAAKTNEPRNYTTRTNVTWEAKRNVFPKLPLPIGISGITIRTYDSSAYLDFYIQDADSLNYAFNKIKVFHYKAPDAFDLAVTDETQTNLAYINSRITTPDFFTTEISLHDTTHSFQLHMIKSDSTQFQSMIYGVELENSQKGLVYDMIGVNGAMFAHYDSSVYFVDQLVSLKPDLIIVSLGTNEAFTKYFNETEFADNITNVITKIRAVLPDANFLLTSPPDGYRYRKYKNASVAKAVAVQKYFCEHNNAAFWDFYHLMGGYGSIYKWYLKGLAQRDYLHLTKAGYEIEGQLLFNALMESYNKNRVQ
ncbi:hypothetical protein LBMAG27_05990 [Bacteroidota bacterium]|nr:hypothetical protein LBMAG27_05990 [Bacteroidota bacterium]